MILKIELYQPDKTPLLLILQPFTDNEEIICWQIETVLKNTFGDHSQVFRGENGELKIPLSIPLVDQS